MVSRPRLRIYAPWATPISLAAWQELWRIFSDGIPVPIVLDLCVESAGEQETGLPDIHQKLVAGGYATWGAGEVQLTRPARDMLSVLARPHREVDIRMEIRGEPVRVLAAAPHRGNVVRVTIHQPIVSLEVVDTVAPELAAVETLPVSPGVGRIRALAIPVTDLERGIERYRSAQFVDTLTKNIGRAALDVHHLLRNDPTLRAKFGIAARDRAGRRARDPFALVVHDSSVGRHMVTRLADHITIDRADDGQITRKLTERLNAMAEHG